MVNHVALSSSYRRDSEEKSERGSHVLGERDLMPMMFI